MLHIYTGDGKGKTTAALGLALRARGRGIQVLWTSFLKDYDSGEFLLPLPFTVHRGVPVTGFWPMLTEGERAEIAAEHTRRLQQVFEQARQKGYGMLVLDEALGALSCGALELPLLLRLLGNARQLDVVLTGRDAPPQLLERADYVSRIQPEKHPYAAGQQARPGIEY